MRLLLLMMPLSVDGAIKPWVCGKLGEVVVCGFCSKGAELLVIVVAVAIELKRQQTKKESCFWQSTQFAKYRGKSLMKESISRTAGC